MYLRESTGNESAISGSNDETGDEETAGYASPIGPAGKDKVYGKHYPQRWQSEGPYMIYIESHNTQHRIAHT